MLMMKEIYFDIHSEDSGGSLFRITKRNGEVHFIYEYSISDPEKDKVEVFQTRYEDFMSFWVQTKKKYPEWHYLHPLFIHPAEREFIRKELEAVDWGSQGGKKWQESHQRQWKKVLNDPPSYYHHG